MDNGLVCLSSEFCSPIIGRRVSTSYLFTTNNWDSFRCLMLIIDLELDSQLYLWLGCIWQLKLTIGFFFEVFYETLLSVTIIEFPGFKYLIINTYNCLLC
ncbi:MAG: hypothetical protein RIS47_2325 [Bacteroidota bacterium]|jgi:hypothetical protein